MPVAVLKHFPLLKPAESGLHLPAKAGEPPVPGPLCPILFGDVVFVGDADVVGLPVEGALYGAVI